MHVSDFSVVIPTRNRPLLLRRAIESAIANGIDEAQIVVIDDCSTDQRSGCVKREFPELRMINLDSQGGPSRARNIGLAQVSSMFAVQLDDDDTLCPGALETIQNCLRPLPQIESYPVFQFRRSSASMSEDFFVASLSDFVRQRFTGDFTQVIQTELFRRLKLVYPETIIGGESQLWFCVAKMTGIPTWNEIVATLHTDAPTRLCSVSSQLARPREYALSIEAILGEFGTDLKAISPEFHRHKKLGAATYRLLAGDRNWALSHAWELCLQGSLMPGAAIAAMTAIPLPVLRHLFGRYRRGIPP